MPYEQSQIEWLHRLQAKSNISQLQHVNIENFVINAENCMRTNATASWIVIFELYQMSVKTLCNLNSSAAAVNILF